MGELVIMNIANKLLGLVLVVILLTLGMSFLPSSQARADDTPTASIAKITIIPPDLQITTPTDFFDESYAQWVAILAAIDAHDLKSVTLDITGMGGVLYNETMTAKQIDDLKSQGTVINMRVIGRAVSANAYIVCNASSFTMDNYSQLYFHYPYTMNTSLFNLIESRDFTEAPYDALDTQYVMDTCIKAGILTKADVAGLKAGKAIVITQYPGKRIKTISNFDNEYLIYFNKGSILNFMVVYLFGLLTLYIVVKIIKKTSNNY